MSKIFPPQPSASENAHIPSMEKYEEIYQSSIADPEKFWAETALRIDLVMSDKSFRKKVDKIIAFLKKAAKSINKVD